MNSTSLLYLFVHLPKSAGTTINKHARKHFLPTQRLTLSPKLIGADRSQITDIVSQTKQYFYNMTMAKREKLSYITGHHLPYNIHHHINKNKKPFYFTFLRDPAQRIASIYNYFCQWYQQDQDKNKKANQLYRQIFLIDDQAPDFIDWYYQKYSPRKNNFPVPSSITFYQQLGYLKPGKLTSKTIQNCFEKFSFVGLVENFVDDAAFIYHQLGINKFFIKQNISKKYFNLNQQPLIATKLRKELVAEYKFYNAAVKYRVKFIDQHPGYQQIVEQMLKKQRLLQPFTQLIFGWPDNLEIISKNLRQYLPGYGLLLDRLKTT